MKIARRDLLAFLAACPEIMRKLQATASYRYTSQIAGALELGRRREVRIGLRRDVELRRNDTRHRVTLLNLSIGGMSLDDAPEDWHPGQDVALDLGLPNGILELAGRVTWREGQRVGLLFERADRNHDMLIQMTIRTLLEKVYP